MFCFIKESDMEGCSVGHIGSVEEFMLCFIKE